MDNLWPIFALFLTLDRNYIFRSKVEELIWMNGFACFLGFSKDKDTKHEYSTQNWVHFVSNFETAFKSFARKLCDR